MTQKYLLINIKLISLSNPFEVKARHEVAHCDDGAQWTVYSQIKTVIPTLTKHQPPLTLILRIHQYHIVDRGHRHSSGSKIKRVHLSLCVIIGHFRNILFYLSTITSFHHPIQRLQVYTSTIVHRHSIHLTAIIYRHQIANFNVQLDLPDNRFGCHFRVVVYSGDDLIIILAIKYIEVTPQKVSLHTCYFLHFTERDIVAVLQVADEYIIPFYCLFGV